LLKAYKANLDLSKKMKVTGAIFSIIFATLATILLIGTGNFILYYLDKNASHTYTTSSVFSHIIFWGLTISSVYLVAGYWATRKETKLKFIRLVSELGENTVV
jgi:Na+-driven multidrug efflux pump